jgi:hypothetical protein
MGPDGSRSACFHPTGRLEGPEGNAEDDFAPSIPMLPGEGCASNFGKLGPTTVVRTCNKMPPRPHNQGVAARLPSGRTSSRSKSSVIAGLLVPRTAPRPVLRLLLS